MLGKTNAFSSYSINDMEKARLFYKEVLGIDVDQTQEGLTLNTGGGPVFLYPKANHTPATFTVLNFQVSDIDAVVDVLDQKGIHFERYGGQIATDPKGIFRGDPGPKIAWFKDPAGNILSLIEE